MLKHEDLVCQKHAYFTAALKQLIDIGN